MDLRHSKLNIVGRESHRGLVELTTIPAENLRGEGNIRGEKVRWKYHRAYGTILNAVSERRHHSKKSDAITEITA